MGWGRIETLQRATRTPRAPRTPRAACAPLCARGRPTRRPPCPEQRARSSAGSWCSSASSRARRSALSPPSVACLRPLPRAWWHSFEQTGAVESHQGARCPACEPGDDGRRVARVAAPRPGLTADHPHRAPPEADDRRRRGERARLDGVPRVPPAPTVEQEAVPLPGAARRGPLAHLRQRARRQRL